MVLAFRLPKAIVKRMYNLEHQARLCREFIHPLVPSYGGAERLKLSQRSSNTPFLSLIVLFGRFFWQCARLSLSLHRRSVLSLPAFGSGEESPGNTEHHAG